MLLGHAKHAGNDTSDATKRDQFAKPAVVQASVAKDSCRRSIGLAHHLRMQMEQHLDQVQARMFAGIYIQVCESLKLDRMASMSKVLLIECRQNRKGKRDNELRPCGSTLVVPRRPLSNGNR